MPMHCLQPADARLAGVNMGLYCVCSTQKQETKASPPWPMRLP